ncbi:MAG: vWA domain-containing protein [Pseudomonadota bacterium]
MLNKYSKNILSVGVLTALSVSSSAPLAQGLGMTQNPAPKVLNVASPADGSVWSRPDGCLAPVLDVKGKTSMEEAQPLDLLLIIDRSGSTQKIVDGTDTVLDIERQAAKALIELLETAGDVHRLGLVSFSRTVSQEASLGSAWDELHTALAGLDNSEGATYPALAIEYALRALENKRPEAQPGIILITDGIPTLCKPDDGSSILDPNGIPQECSKATDKDGGTQERDDRLVTLSAAELAKAAGVPIYPVIIEPENQIDRKLTTMPSVHDITGAAGQVPRLNKNNLDQLSYVVTHLPITGVTQVDASNLDATESVEPNVLGEFEAKVFVGTGDNDLRISAHTGDPANAKEVNLTINVTEDAAANVLACSDLAPNSVIIGVNNDEDKFKVSLESHNGTTWTYRVEEIEGKDLSHWVLGTSNFNYSCEGKIVSSSPQSTGIGKDGNRPFYGIKWDVGGGFSNSTFSFTLDADYPESTVEVLIKTGGKEQTNTGLIIGPDCS